MTGPALQPGGPMPTLTASMRHPVTALIIARDEEVNLPDCLHSIVGWCEQVLVVLDPRTTDRSRAVAEAAGATVVDHAFESFAQQRNWAVDSGAVSVIVGV